MNNGDAEIALHGSSTIRPSFRVVIWADDTDKKNVHSGVTDPGRGSYPLALPSDATGCVHDRFLSQTVRFFSFFQSQKSAPFASGAKHLLA